MNLVIDSLLTTYSELGSGKRTILFLHGWADSSRTFEGLASELVKGSDYRAILLDLPGFGGTLAPKTDWGLSEYADFVKSFIDKLELSVDVIVGHSNGCSIAIHGLSSGRFTARKAVFIGAAGIREPSLKKSVYKMLSIPAKTALKLAPSHVQKRIKTRLYGAIGSDYLVAEHMKGSFRKVVSEDLRQAAARIDIPVMLIYGENDDATPVTYGKIYEGAIPGSRLQTVPLTGHFVHQEQVYKVARFIEEFIKD
jgi:pimeloyl-ACP methyl ester carboxylesterase